MKALVIEKPHLAVVKEVPYPHPKPGEITVKVERSGICGTDLHIFEGEYVSPYPIIPGHEFSGVVHEVGDGVEQFKPGDRVAADPNLFCGRCKYCLTHRANQCERFGAVGVTINGSMAEFVAVPAKNAVLLPDSMSFAEGAFIEPLACVVQGMNQLQLKAGSRVILFGAGAMGQQLVQAISRSGASELVVVDVSQEKLDLAMKYGATKALLSGELQQSGKTLFPDGFDAVVDATGIPAVIEQAFQYLGPSATFLQFGVASPNDVVRLSPFQLYRLEWKLVGTMAINYTFLPAMQWLKEGRFHVEPLISRTITLEEAVRFFHGERYPNDLKIQIQL